jgi:hypothetical protein
MADTSDYTEARAQVFCAALESGLPPALAAREIGFSVSTVYHWRKQRPEFAERWMNAVAIATGNLERLVYQFAREGQPWALLFWLRSHHPRVYDRAALARIAEQQMRLALAGYSPGPGPAVNVDENGWPIVARTPDSRPRVTFYMPFNGRERGGVPVNGAASPDSEPPPAASGDPAEIPVESADRAPDLSPEPAPDRPPDRPPDLEPDRSPDLAAIPPPGPKRPRQADVTRWQALAS